MKRWIILITLLCLLTNLCAAAEYPPHDSYIYPDHWSREALIFAVENGILAGDENRDLLPDKNITRAEMAAVLVRLLGATQTIDLSAYDDVERSAWYYHELSAAVACGIFSGVSATAMRPNQAITREQAVVVLCRAFGIVTDARDNDQAFSDQAGISAYARDSVSAMRALGLLDGYSDGSFGPKRSITRAEVAQLLYNLFDCIADTPEEIPASGTVMYRGAQALPDTLILDGMLILGQKTPSGLTARHWSISEALVLRTGKDFQIDLSGLNTAKLVCAPLSGTILCAELPTLYLWGNSSEFYGNVAQLTVMGGTHEFYGNSENATIRSGKLTYNGDAGAIMMEDATTLVMNGIAESITIDGEYATLSGSGRAELIISYPEHKTITLAYDELKDIWLEAYLLEHDSALEVVQTQRIPCTVWSVATLYADRAMTTAIRILEVGTKVYFEYHPDDRVYVSLDDGTKGWMMRWTCSYTDNLITTDGSLDYSTPIKEGFVDLHGYESETEYLIWVSRYTQKVMVYQGTKGDWALICTFPCSTGKNETPTPAGTFAIFGHTEQWNFSDHCVQKVTSFNGNHAFHTVLLNYDGSYYNSHVGDPLSHGCVRLMPEDAQYIYNLPIGTCVVVY